MFGLLIVCYFLLEEYEYKEDLKQEFVQKIGDLIYSGTVSRDGIFIPDQKEPPCPARGYFFWGGGVRRLWSHPKGKTKLYELRYGMLIPMKVDEWSRIVPEKGEKIIPFEEYRFSIFARPIYNLPGTWLKKGAVFDDQKPLPKNISLKSK